MDGLLPVSAARFPPKPAPEPASVGTSPPCDTQGDVTAQLLCYIGTMNMRMLMLAPIVALALTLPAHAEKIGLKDLSKYLNALSSAETDFTQVNADGTISTGKLYIKRPGRVRFEYAPPDASLVLASAGTVAIFDSKSNQPPEQYPLKRTPLNLILAETVDLSRASMVVGHTEDGTSTRVKAQDPQHPEYGTIELVFTADPVTLRQWVIVDDAGSETTVILGEMKGGGNYPTSLFSIKSEQDRRGG
jgi:outer membrane lipoprotein-sorting protein